MSVYTAPALNAVDFALTAVTPANITPYTIALSAYTPPATSAVDFALTTFTGPTFPDVGFELLAEPPDPPDPPDPPTPSTPKGGGGRGYHPHGKVREYKRDGIREEIERAIAKAQGLTKSDEPEVAKAAQKIIARATPPKATTPDLTYAIATLARIEAILVQFDRLQAEDDEDDDAILAMWF